MRWEDVLDPNNGYIKDDTVVFEVEVTVNAVSPIKISKVHLKPSEIRSLDLKDPRENMCRFIESHFYKHCRGGMIETIDIVSNKYLKPLFKQKQNEFKSKDIPHLPIFAYHGTNETNIENILHFNFDVTKAKRQAHGQGNYFSENPNTALTYSDDKQTLLLCQILPGRQYNGPDHTWPEFESKVVMSDQDNQINSDIPEMVIIINRSQILPCAVVHLLPRTK